MNLVEEVAAHIPFLHLGAAAKPAPSLPATATQLGTNVAFTRPTDAAGPGYSVAFRIAIERVLGNEGKYTDGAGDPGGETNWGISKRSYPDLDIKSLTRDQAIAIYWRDFWTVVHSAEMPPALAYQGLDFAVNSGCETAIRKLQHAIGAADDGHWGPATAAALKALPVHQAVMLFVAERMDFQRKLKNWSAAGDGWTGRNALNLRYGALDT